MSKNRHYNFVLQLMFCSITLMRTMQVVDVMSDQIFSLARSKGIKWPNTLFIIDKYRFSLMIFKLSDAVLNLSNVHKDYFSFV